MISLKKKVQILGFNFFYLYTTPPIYKPNKLEPKQFNQASVDSPVEIPW